MPTIPLRSDHEGGRRTDGATTGPGLNGNSKHGHGGGPSATSKPDWASRLMDGETWLRSGSRVIEPLWGDDRYVLAARYQPTIVAGASGAGKTTVIQQVALGSIGVAGYDRVLGLPVLQTPGKVLLLAADRPDQARLSMLRMVSTPEAMTAVAARLVVMAGPPPNDIAADPALLIRMAQYTGATLIIPDSLKDMAIGLPEDAVGAKVNNAFQKLVADGRDVIVPHHVRKVGRQDRSQPVTLDDLYGSAWIFNGAGSVVHLEAGPIDRELKQLKTPNGENASLRFALTPTGEAVVGVGDPALRAVVSAGAEGAPTSTVAKAVFKTDRPTDSQIEKVRRQLKALEEQGHVNLTGTARSSRWVATG